MSATTKYPNANLMPGRSLAPAPGSAAPTGELRVLEYELGQITLELAKLCGYIDNIQKRLGQAIPPNDQAHPTAARASVDGTENL